MPIVVSLWLSSQQFVSQGVVPRQDCWCGRAGSRGFLPPSVLQELRGIVLQGIVGRVLAGREVASNPVCCGCWVGELPANLMGLVAI